MDQDAKVDALVLAVLRGSAKSVSCRAQAKRLGALFARFGNTLTYTPSHAALWSDITVDEYGQNMMSPRWRHVAWNEFVKLREKAGIDCTTLAEDLDDDLDDDSLGINDESDDGYVPEDESDFADFGFAVRRAGERAQLRMFDARALS